MFAESIVWLALFAGDPQRTNGLDALVRRIPEVASPARGISDAEHTLATELQRLGAAAIPRLLPLLADPNEDVRDLVGYTLRDIEGLAEEHLDALIAAHDHGNGWIAPAIARTGSERAVTYLVKQLEQQPPARAQIEFALMLTGDKGVLEIARRLRKRRSPSDDFAESTYEVCRKLGARAEPAIDALLAVALDEESILANRVIAVVAVGNIGITARRATQPLRALADRSPEKFASAVEDALLAMRGPEAAELLVRKLEAGVDRWLLRDIALFGENARGAGPAVAKCLVHADHDVRVQAVIALGRFGDTQWIDTLIPLLRDPDDWLLVASAAEALARLHAERAVQEIENVAKTHGVWRAHAAATRALAVLRGTDSYTDDAGMERPDSAEPPPLGVLPMFSAGPDALPNAELAKLVYTCESLEYTSSGRQRVAKPQIPECGLRVTAGMLLGATRGEWGGELVLVRPNAPQQLVLDDNVIGVHRFGAHIVAVAGLAHLGMESATLYRIEPRPDGSYAAIWWKRLPSEPGISGITPTGRLFVRCRDADFVLAP